MQQSWYLNFDKLRYREVKSFGHQWNWEFY